MNPVAGPTLAERAYDQLKDLLLSGDLRPGQVLNEGELLRRVESTRTPLREAVQRLASESFLMVKPRRGIYVLDLDLKRLSDWFGARELLEVHCATEAASRIGAASLEELKTVLRRIDRLSERPEDGRTLRKLNGEFHLGIARAAGNEVIVRLLSSLYDHTQRALNIFLQDQHRREWTKEHWDIYKALERHDPTGAAQAALAHIVHIKQILAETLFVGADRRLSLTVTSQASGALARRRNSRAAPRRSR